MLLINMAKSQSEGLPDRTSCTLDLCAGLGKCLDGNLLRPDLARADKLAATCGGLELGEERFGLAGYLDNMPPRRQCSVPLR